MTPKWLPWQIPANTGKRIDGVYNFAVQNSPESQSPERKLGYRDSSLQLLKVTCS